MNCKYYRRVFIFDHKIKKEIPSDEWKKFLVFARGCSKKIMKPNLFLYNGRG